MGFGLGDVTLRNFLETHKLLPAPTFDIDVFVTTPSEKEFREAKTIAATLRAAGLKVALPLSFEGFGAQLKKAAKANSRWAVLFGEEEHKRQAVVVKDLQSGAQSEVAIVNLATHFRK